VSGESGVGFLEFGFGGVEKSRVFVTANTSGSGPWVLPIDAGMTPPHSLKKEMEAETEIQ